MENGQEQSAKNLIQLICEEQWSNAACCGYMRIACKILDYSEKQTEELLSAMQIAFGNYTVEYAKKKYLCE